MWIKSQTPWFKAADNSWTAIHFRMSCNPALLEKAKISVQVVGVIDGKTQKSIGSRTVTTCIGMMSCDILVKINPSMPVSNKPTYEFLTKYEPEENLTEASAMIESYEYDALSKPDPSEGDMHPE